MDKWIRRRELLGMGIPPSVIEQFEFQKPTFVIRNNPMAKNSPKLYNLEAFERWWKTNTLSQGRGNAKELKWRTRKKVV